MKHLVICLAAVIALYRSASAEAFDPDPDAALRELRGDTASLIGDEIPTIDANRAEPALACQSGWVPCGADYCIPSGTVCCASVGRPDRYCQQGYACQPDGTCTQSGGGGGTCPSGQKVCGNNFCIPSTGVCCDTQGHYCNSGYTCSADGQQCIPNTGGGGSQTCGSGQRLSDWDCSGTSSDVCGCADACSAGSTCQSGCCMNGFCAPSAACSSQCSISYGSCGGGGNTDPGGDTGGGGGFGGDGGGCSASAGTGAGVLMLLLFGIAWRRPRKVAR